MTSAQKKKKTGKAAGQKGDANKTQTRETGLIWVAGRRPGGICEVCLNLDTPKKEKTAGGGGGTQRKNTRKYLSELLRKPKAKLREKKNPEGGKEK